ncbi:MAG TPA: DDE-type integrase/transposase/recombinase [Bacillota bacterium]|nr:DDE-type integrase/transposase/recombinase [Bacillota bacterium]
MGKQLFQPALDVMELSKILTGIGNIYSGKEITDAPLEEYKSRFQTHGLEALKDLRPLKKMRPRVTSRETVQTIMDLSLEHPGWGCIKISQALKEAGKSISSPTVQSILNKNNLRDRVARITRLEEQFLRQEVELSPEQMRMIEKINPCFRERFHESLHPGELLVQDTFYIGEFKKAGKAYLQVVVDTYNSYAFCLLHKGKHSDYAVALLHNEVFPFYKRHGLEVKQVLTDNGREYCGKERHHYTLYMMLNDIEHQRLPLRECQKNGFMQRFRRSIQKEFFNPQLRKGKTQEITLIQQELVKWLDEYNHHRGLRGYPNLGKSPEQMLEDYLKNFVI